MGLWWFDVRESLGILMFYFWVGFIQKEPHGRWSKTQHHIIHIENMKTLQQRNKHRTERVHFFWSIHRLVREKLNRQVWKPFGPRRSPLRAGGAGSSGWSVRCLVEEGYCIWVRFGGSRAEGNPETLQLQDFSQLNMVQIFRETEQKLLLSNFLEWIHVHSVRREHFCRSTKNYLKIP